MTEQHWDATGLLEGLEGTAEARAALFQELLESAPDATVVTNDRGEIVFVNRQVERLFGYSRGELLGKQVEILVPSEFKASHPRVREGYASHPQFRPMGADLSLSGRRKDGSTVPVEISLSPIRTARGLLISSTIRDVSERYEAQQRIERQAEALARSNAELEAFTYSVSHDLKEPLRTLEAFSGFVLEDYADKLDEQGRDYLERISRGSVRMKVLIEDLLTLSRAGRQRGPPERVDVQMVVGEIVRSLDAMLQERQARVEANDDLPPVLGDESRVHQVFWHLISNGLKFNEGEHPIVRVRTDGPRDGMATFCVEDNGIGIDPAYHERVFDVFQRLQRREDYEGTGAGLAIVKRILDSYGGTIEVESQPGAGARFVFTLPRWQNGEGALAEERAA